MFRTSTAVLCIATIALLVVFPGAAVYVLLPPVMLADTVVYGESPCPAEVTTAVQYPTTLVALASSRHLARASLPHTEQ